MATHAPRDRSVVLLDDNVRKALLQLDRAYAESLRDHNGMPGAKSKISESLTGHDYYELDIDRFLQMRARARRPIDLE